MGVSPLLQEYKQQLMRLGVLAVLRGAACRGSFISASKGRRHLTQRKPVQTQFSAPLQLLGFPIPASAPRKQSRISGRMPAAASSPGGQERSVQQHTSG